MSLVKFTLGYAPDRYPSRLQRYAVLHPLTTVCRSQEEIVRCVEKLQTQWRARVLNLQNGRTPRGLFPDYAQNCFPTFVRSTPITRTCNQRAICPFCYARDLVRRWIPIDAAVRAAGDCQLIERRVKGGVSFQDDMRPDIALEVRLRALLKLALTGRTELAAKIAEEGVVGSLSTLVVWPGRHGWVFSRRELYLAPPRYKAPFGWEDIRVTQAPDRLDTVRALARTFRYPVPLMRKDPGKTVLLLDARRGLRLSATYGAFRGTSDESI